MPLTKLTLTISEDLRRRAKSVAALRNESVSEVVRRALEEYVSQAPEPGNVTQVDQAALDALEEARRVREMMHREYGEFPEGWSVQVIREVREEA